MTLYGFSQKTAIFAKTFWRMRELIINTSERIGGAAVAASRLMEALKNNGIKAKMLVRDKQTDQISVVGLDRSWLTLWKFVWERIVIWKANHFKKNNLFAVDIANTGTDVTSLPEFRQEKLLCAYRLQVRKARHAARQKRQQLRVSVLYFPSLPRSQPDTEAPRQPTPLRKCKW